MAQAQVWIGDIDDTAASPQSDAPVHVRRLMPVPRSRHEAEADIPTLTKAELAELVCDHVGLNKREAKDMVDWFFEEMRHALERGESVKLTGFGNFLLRDKAERPGRNPKTGEQVSIAARRVVTFQPSQKLKGIVDTGTTAEGIDQTRGLAARTAVILHGPSVEPDIL
jgi:integration host factor subunit alpha